MQAECPYCEKDIEIVQDDGFGTDEGELYQYQCDECEKYFVFNVTLTWNAWPEKADCLNEGDHVWRQQTGWPEEHFVGKFECEQCGEEKTEKSNPS